MVLVFIRFLVDIVCFLTTQCTHNCWTRSYSLVGVCKSFVVVWTGRPHRGFFMLSCVKNVDCVFVLQLLLRTKLFKFSGCQGGGCHLVSWVMLAHALCRLCFCPATLALCSSVLALMCCAVMGSRGVLCLNIACRIWLRYKRPSSQGQCLRFAAESFTAYSVGRL